MRQRELLKMEYEYERAAFAAASGRVPAAVRVRRGLAWFPVEAGRSYYNSVNQYVVVVERAAREEGWPEHAFEYGRPVRFFECGGIEGKDGGRWLGVTGTVSFVDGDRMGVAVGSEADAGALRGVVGLGVQLSFDETTYRLMFQALDDVMGAEGNRLAQLRDVMLGEREAMVRELRPQVFPWLNGSQQEAVNGILRAKDVAVVHGPPGTGKTTTLVEAVVETLFRETQVMVCAQSNMAVDWICGKLAERGVSVLRVGNPSRIDETMLGCSFERRFEEHPDYPLLWSVRKSLRECQAAMAGKSRSRREELRERMDVLRRKAVELEFVITESLMGEARVVACTLAGAASKVLVGRRYTTLFVDEAAQALEAAAWIAVAKADRVVFAGDHYQLPPTVKCVAALREGLGVTLMQSVAANKPSSVFLLTMQYRMNEAIMRFSSDVFYDGRLVAAPQVRERDSLCYGRPMEWVDTTGMGFAEEAADDGTSRRNRGEAVLVVSVLRDVVQGLGERVAREHVDFGVIAPYRAQVALLRKLVWSDPVLRPLRGCISVNTVDGFQGQERDVVIVGLVRSNDDGNIGFLSELRRMNVAVTRARYKLIVVGDVSTMGRHPFYRLLARRCGVEV